jgi:Trk K+ transport system NAD-binding subunit
MAKRSKRKLYSYWRYSLFLLREFRVPLVVFWLLVFGGGALIWPFYRGHELGYFESAYGVFMLIFMESALEFPDEWYLQPLWFLIPIVGLGAVADSLVRLGYLVFARKERLQEWHVMHASMLRDHIVLVGAGQVGVKIVRDLLALRESVVVVDRKTEGELIDEVLDLGVPLIAGSCRQRKTLEKAGVARAKSVILATDDDLANLDGALTAREIRPDVPVVLRIFDDTLANKVATSFKMPAVSIAASSAPSFIAAATGHRVLAGFSLDGSETLHIADVEVCADGPITGRDVGAVQTEFQVNIVLHRRGERTQVNPEHELVLEPGDRMLVLAPIECIANLERAAPNSLSPATP